MQNGINSQIHTVFINIIDGIKQISNSLVMYKDFSLYLKMFFSELYRQKNIC